MLAQMPPVRARWSSGVIVALVLATGGPTLAAQGSPYLSLDDPRLPLLEHLIAKGAVRDPSPQIRPLLVRDALQALQAAAADSNGSSAGLVRGLLQAWALPTSEAWWRIAPRGGIQAYSQGRRELLQPGGMGNLSGYADASFVLALGPVVLSARPAAEDRLRDDPDFRPYQPNGQFKQLYRFIEGYATVRWKWGGVHFGQIARNWGPGGLTGIALGNEGYPRTDLGYWFGNRTIRFEGASGPLRDGTNGSGESVSRWFAAHRLAIRVHSSLDLALWEAGVAQRAPGGVDPAILNPFVLMIFGRQFGIGDRRNPIIGGDLSWRPTPRLLLQAQGAIDDWTFDPAVPTPNRFGLGLAGSGALGRSLSWRAGYALNSSLLYQTFDPSENFTDAGIGLGRNFVDNDRFSISVGIPVRTHWLISPQADWLRQGEGRIDGPWPDTATLGTVPVLFRGIRRDTWQVAIGVSGQEGGLALSGLGGVQRVRNAGHVSGAMQTRLVGRLQATIGFRVGGDLHQPEP